MESILHVLALSFPFVTVVFFGWLGHRFVRAREREALHDPAAATAELRQLEEQVQLLQGEVESIGERQEFTEKLLERPKESSR